MSRAARVGELALLLLWAGASAALPQSLGLSGNGSIEGQITLAGKPISGVTVTLAPKSGKPPDTRTVSATDEAGRFRFTDVEVGDYVVDVFAPAFVGIGASLSNPARGRSVTLRDGETVTGVDIALTRGGVITGRVLDANRHPIIEMTVDLTQVDLSGRVLPRIVRPSEQFMYRTDDTGTYRIFGLPAGRYKVSVGVQAGAGAIRYEGGYYRRTYYPGVRDEAEAEIVEVAEGAEAHNIDVLVGPFEKSYSAAGRVVNSDTGKPLAGWLCGYGAVSESSQYIGTVAVLSAPSGSKGEFVIAGLRPGRYAAFVVNEGNIPLYCEPSFFEITDADVSGIEIRTRAGASLSGTIAFEDDARIESFERLAVDVIVTPPALEPFRRETVRISPDGRFSAVGLRPGRATIGVRGSIQGKNVILSRIEVNGVTQEFLELRAGEAVTGVRLVLSRQPEPRQ